MEGAERVGTGTGISRPGAPAPQSERALPVQRQALARERDALERERAALDQFAAMAAHEMLKPLVLTEACATSIGERAGHLLDEESREELETLVRVSSRMRMLVDALLLDARDRERPLRREPVDLAQLVDDCIETLSGEIQARKARVEVEPLPVVRANPALLQGVFGNLLSNALKYGVHQGGTIRVTVMHESAGWIFGVESPGPPIPERERQRIFEPWQRGRNARDSRGAGLGLSIVRRLVERHGGEVGVAPRAGWCNRVYFTLPG